VAAGLIPGVGPIIGAGILAATLGGAAAGAAAGGMLGALTGLGVPEDEAEYYEGEFKSGRTLLTVKADGRAQEATSILRRFGAYDIDSRGATTGTTTPVGTTAAGTGTPATTRDMGTGAPVRSDRAATPQVGTSGSATTGRSWNDVSPSYRQDFERRSASSGQRWEDQEPYYRYSHEMRQDPRFRGRRFTEAEPELRTGYREWARRQGYQANESGWDRFRSTGAEFWDRDDDRTDVQQRTEGGQRVQLREEELRAQKETVQAGEVGIRKDVVEEERTMEVPVSREEVYIERHPVEGRPASGDIREGEEIRVPVREEQVHLEKETVAREELEIGKRTVEDTEQVSGTVRREEAHIEREGDVDVQGDDQTRRGRPA
jgi:uncharacterized protein (TIGR02271 family)